MKYKHIVSGNIVESDMELPETLFEKVVDKPAAKKAPAKKPLRETAKKED